MTADEMKQMKGEVEDLSHFATREAVDRIMQIADVLPDRQLKLVTGLKAARTLYVSFLMAAIDDGMPHQAAEGFVRDTIDTINAAIADLAKTKKDENNEHGSQH